MHPSFTRTVDENKVETEATLSRNLTRNNLLEHCGIPLTTQNVKWSNGGTEAGTPFCRVWIECNKCDKELVYVNSWYPGCDNVEEAVGVLNDDDWEMST